MCRLKSGIILKDRVFIPDYDHHTDMLKELGIEDTTRNAETLFVRAELVPINNDIFSDVDSWQFIVDQDIIPEWFVIEYEKKRMVEEVKLWVAKYVHINKSNITIRTGKHYFKNCKEVEAYNSSTVIITQYSLNGFENITLTENATLKDCRQKKIYQSGDWDFVKI